MKTKINTTKDCNFIDVELGSYKTCDFLSLESAKKARQFVKTHPDYQPTPLVSLEELSKLFGVKKIYVKDESKRMGLNAFKGVGVLYAVSELIAKKFDLDIDKISFKDFLEPRLNEEIRKLTLAAATDGNHGKGLAWVAKKLGCKCHIYMPKNTSKFRVEAIEDLGAKVMVTDLNYDHTLRLVIEEANKKGWLHIQDQAWDGYTEIANAISRGYTIIGDEILDQMKKDATLRPTHIILQAGAGTFAFGIFGYFTNIFFDNKPYMVVAESKNAACFYKSIEEGKFTRVSGDLETLMAGLSVGEPNIVAWENLQTIVEGYASCSDEITARGMRILSSPLKDDKRIISGESGALGLGLASMICQSLEYKKIKELMKINEESVLLFINTEGDTDPESYKRIVWDGKLPSNLG